MQFLKLFGILSILLCCATTEGSRIRIKDVSGKCWRAIDDAGVSLEVCSETADSEFHEVGGDGYLGTPAGTKLESVAKPGLCLARGIDGFKVQNLWHTKEAAIISPWCLHECSNENCLGFDSNNKKYRNAVLMDTCVGRSALWVNDGVWLRSLDSGNCLRTCTTEECKAGPVYTADGEKANAGYNVFTEECSRSGSLYWSGTENSSLQRWWQFTTGSPDGDGLACLDACVDPALGCNEYNGEDVGETMKSRVGKESRNVYTVKCGDFNAGDNQLWALVPHPLEPGLVLRNCDDPLTNLWSMKDAKIKAITGALERADPCVTSQLLVKDCTGENSPQLQWSIQVLAEQQEVQTSESQDSENEEHKTTIPAASPESSSGSNPPFWKSTKFRIGIACATGLVVVIATLCMIIFFRNQGAEKPQPKRKPMDAKPSSDRKIMHKQSDRHTRRGSRSKQLSSDKDWMAASLVSNHSGGSTPSGGSSSIRSGQPDVPLLDNRSKGGSEANEDSLVQTVTLDELNTFLGKSQGQGEPSMDIDDGAKEVLKDDVSNALEKIAVLTEGTVFSGRYIMESKRFIGTGGVVCFAKNQFNKEPVAIKFYADEKSFQRELEVNRLVSSHNIVRLEDVVESQDKVFPSALVFERADYTMEEWLRKARPRPLSQKLALHQILEALMELHQHHVIHGDLKPSNIMWSSNDHAWKLADFGSWSKAQEPSPVSYTLMYASPEVIAANVKGKDTVTLETSADMWSFGIIAYEVITGMRFYGTSTSSSQVLEMLLGFSQLPGVDAVTEPQARRLIRSLIQRDPQTRWTSAIAQRNAFFRSAEDTKQQQETWGMVNAKLDRIEQITANTATEIQAANMMITVLIDNVHGDIEDGSWITAPPDEVLMGKDDELPDNPIFMLPISPQFRFRIAITHDHNLALQVSSVQYVQIQVADGDSVVLHPEITSDSADMVECAALWDPKSHGSQLLGTPTPSSGPIDKRVVGLQITVSLCINGMPPVELKGRLFCQMHKNGSNFTCRKIFRRVGQKWKDAPGWVKDGVRGTVLLLSVGASAAGLR